MIRAFADAFYYLALTNTSDSAHHRAVEISRTKRLRTITTDWVLTEVRDALASSAHRSRFGHFIKTLRAASYLEIVPFSAELFNPGIDRYVARPDKLWSLTDCISFVVMEDRSLTDALTADRHFAQAGYKLLLG